MGHTGLNNTLVQGSKGGLSQNGAPQGVRGKALEARATSSRQPHLEATEVLPGDWREDGEHRGLHHHGEGRIPHCTL